ncbi:hypothetical protein PTTG_08524 [Puccinia triticina 1-1 BBBD Race 1]|uniref:Uncharacterized protein n=2 Tax=Puccinia triticina TaxID=208348 RepID=A0A0C4F5W9_PUCT1|nr:hypothetical protein PTTG_08524 [Puccinia triticina 1-1 BBBD Race 1]
MVTAPNPSCPRCPDPSSSYRLKDKVMAVCGAPGPVPCPVLRPKSIWRCNNMERCGVIFWRNLARNPQDCYHDDKRLLTLEAALALGVARAGLRYSPGLQPSALPASRTRVEPPASHPPRTSMFLQPKNNAPELRRKKADQAGSSTPRELPFLLTKQQEEEQRKQAIEAESSAPKLLTLLPTKAQEKEIESQRKKARQAESLRNR